MRHSTPVLATFLAVAMASCAPNVDTYTAPKAQESTPAKAADAAVPAAPAPEAKPKVEPLKASPGTTLYGAKLTEGKPIAIAEILKAPADHKDKQILVNGTVRKICQKKGCWMEMADSSDASLPGCRVMFKDYGFFVPMDAGGAQAKLEGTIEIHTLEKETVAHLESDGGVVANKQADGTAQEIRFIASGVELTL